MFLSFRKNKETKCISVQISKKISRATGFLKYARVFHFQKYVDQKYL